jgi:flavin-dependent dehydrogenase
VLSRSAFDAALVDEAVQAGVTFEDGVAAEIGAADSAGRSVALQGMCPDRPAARTLHAKVVVYAGGLAGASFRHDSSLRSTPIATAYIGAGAETTSHAGFYAPGTIYMATHAAGYAGLTHTEDGSLNIAAAIDPRFVTAKKGLGPAVAAIVQQAGFPAEQLAELDWIGTPPLTRRPANVAAERLFLVGDAAGYVEPFTGEGMSWAIAAATHLAPIVSEAVRDWSPQYVQTWSRCYRRTIGRRQRVCRVVAYGLRSRLLVSTAIRVLRPFPSAAAPVLRHLATT